MPNDDRPPAASTADVDRQTTQRATSLQLSGRGAPEAAVRAANYGYGKDLPSFAEAAPRDGRRRAPVRRTRPR